MPDLQHVVCGVDFSEPSLHALDHGVAMGRRFDVPVTVVHIILPGEDATAATRELQRLAASARAIGVSSIDVRVIEGSPWRELVAQVGSEGSMLVLGTHGKSGFERLLLGSVTEKTLRAAPSSVLTVPPAGPGASPPLTAFNRILCATDFSPASESAIAWASAITERDGAELVVLHVLASCAVPQSEGFPRSSLAAYRAAYVRWAEQRLHSAVPQSARTRCAIQELTAAGRAHEVILSVAAERACELLVMGVEGHRALGSRVFGSTAEHVVRMATCPVLTVKP